MLIAKLINTDSGSLFDCTSKDLSPSLPHKYHDTGFVQRKNATNNMISFNVCVILGDLIPPHQICIQSHHALN